MQVGSKVHKVSCTKLIVKTFFIKESELDTLRESHRFNCIVF